MKQYNDSNWKIGIKELPVVCGKLGCAAPNGKGGFGRLPFPPRGVVVNPKAAGDDVPKVGTFEDEGVEQLVTDGMLKIGFEFVPAGVSDDCCGVPKPLLK